MSYRWRSTAGLAALILPGVILMLVGCMLVGCNKGHTPSSAPGAPAGTASASGGEALFKTTGCDRCHTLGGQGGRRAPDLTHVAADATHTQQWIAD